MSLSKRLLCCRKIGVNIAIMAKLPEEIMEYPKRTIRILHCIVEQYQYNAQIFIAKMPDCQPSIIERYT